MNNNYLLEGDDSFVIDLKIKCLIVQHNFEEASTSTYDLAETTLSTALEDLDTYGLFSEKKVIIIQNIESFNLDEYVNEFQHFLEYLKHPVTERLVIVTAKKLNNTKKITKTLKKTLKYIAVSINALDYVKQELKEYKVESGGLKQLVTSCLEDIGKIHQECEKLKIYCMDTKFISLEDIRNLVLKKMGDSTDITFEFVRILASKDKRKSLEKYHELLEYQIEPLALIGLLASQFRIMYQVKVLQKEKLSNEEIATRLSEKSSYRISKTKELTRYYSEGELLSLLRNLADIDLKIKTSDVDGKFLIELFILNI